MAGSIWRSQQRPLAIYNGQTPIVPFDPDRRVLLLSATAALNNVTYGPWPLVDIDAGIYGQLSARSYVTIEYSVVGTLVCSEWYCYTGGTATRLNIVEVILQR